MRNIYILSQFSVIAMVMLCCMPGSKQPVDVLVEQGSSSIRDSIFVSPFSGYGYDIIVNGEVKIHQPHIQVIASKIGFTCKEDARKVARLVVHKIELNQIPPIVTFQELKELGVDLK